MNKKQLLSWGLLPVLAVTLLAPGPALPSSLVAANPPAVALDPGRVTWSRLTYRASKLLISATAQVELTVVPAGETETVSSLGPGGLFLTQVTQSPTLLLTLDSRLLGKDSHLKLWMDPSHGGALQQIQIEKRRRKTYRFVEDAVLSWRHSPRDSSEAKTGAESWSQVEETSYPYPGLATPAVLEPSGIFYVLAAGPPLHVGQRREILVFTKRRFTRVEMAVQERVELKVDYKEQRAAGEKSRQGRVQVLEVALLVRPFDAPQGDGRGDERVDLEFLGLEGEIHLYVDEKTGIPLQVSGRVPPVGRVNVKLKGVVFR